MDRAEKNTPIYHFLQEYTSRHTARFHMPGHKGNGIFIPEPFCSVLPYDITEVAGADALYEATGIIGESEAITAAFYGVKNTCFSAGGSTLSILTMMAVAATFGAKILAVRNSHLAFVNACALLGLEPIWLYPMYDQTTGLCLPISADEIDAALRENPDCKTVYLTSPDYYGVIADIRAIADVVHCHGAILLVDNAHGAHLKVLLKDIHPMTLGADLCCDSPHKTLPVLTGGGYLHSNLAIHKTELKRKMALFGSTSPSYLILASLDLCNAYLAEQARADFAALTERVTAAEQVLLSQGVALLPRKSDPAKIVFDCQKCGFTHQEMSEILRKQGIEPEYAGGGKIVLMFSPCNDPSDFGRLLQATQNLPRRDSIPYPDCTFFPKRILSVREATFAPSEQISVEESVGRIAAESKVICPPAIPIVTAGERIGKTEKNLLQNSGIFLVKVVK